MNAFVLLMFSDVLWPSSRFRATRSSEQMPPQAMFMTSTEPSSLYVAIIPTGIGKT